MNDKSNIYTKNKILEDIHYYNNTFKIVENVLFIDRVYMVDESKFKDSDYDVLSQIYESLPEFKGYMPCPMWFCENEQSHHLIASFEPSGIQISGYLPKHDFDIWEDLFHDLCDLFS